jgi:hypothetical protein
MMTFDSVDHWQQRIADIGPDGRYRSFVEIERHQPLHRTPDRSAYAASAGARPRRNALLAGASVLFASRRRAHNQTRRRPLETAK